MCWATPVRWILNGYSLAGYWTHYGPTGWYADTVVQGTFYQGSATTEFASLPLNGAGVITSVEAGYPIPLPWFGPRFVLEPQGQIIWQQVSFDQANDGLGPIGLGTTSGATGRLGLRGRWTIPGGTGPTLNDERRNQSSGSLPLMPP